jgi:uncharacterized membrane protein YqjE
MPDPQGSGPGPGPSLFASLRSFWSVLLAILYTRLDLASAELEDQAGRIVRMILSGIVGLLSLHCAFFFAVLWVLAAFWDTQYRLLVIGLIFGVYFIGAVLGLALAYSIFVHRPKFMSQTIAELRRDVEGLNRMIKKDEEKAP